LEKYWNQTERDHPNLSTKPWDSENSEGKFCFFLQRQIKERMVETCRKSNERQEFQNQAQLTSNAFIIHQRRELIQASGHVSDTKEMHFLERHH
jgi:outer membrane lipopolysaccharide assembly protein LptE/RlpB